MNYNSKFDLKKMVIAAILLALMFLFAFTPVGFIKLGPAIEITILMIPVAIGACVLGWKYGMFLGFMFGMLSFLQCFGFSAFGAVILGINPIYTFIVCVVSRTLMGLCTSLLFQFVSKIDKTRFVSYIVGSISGAAFNTIFFVLFFLIFFRNANLVEFGMDLSTMSIWAIAVALVALNGLVEIGVCTVIGTAVAKPLSRVVSENKKF